MRLIAGAVALGAVAALLAAERIWPLRASAGDAPRRRERLVTNAALGVLAAATSAVVEAPLVAVSTSAAERHKWGLSRLPAGGLRTALGVLWLDYTLYLWHRASHLAPALWRFHLPHHLDPALDTTTAFRFHVLELALSAPYRWLQISLLGVPKDAVSLWQKLLLASISFHHSNLRLPERLDRALGLVIMTPRLHGIHHSERPEQRDSNWSSGLTLWDRLHRTYLRPADEPPIAIGVAGERAATGFREALLAPWRRHGTRERSAS